MDTSYGIIDLPNYNMHFKWARWFELSVYSNALTLFVLHVKFLNKMTKHVHFSSVLQLMKIHRKNDYQLRSSCFSNIEIKRCSGRNMSPAR